MPININTITPNEIRAVSVCVCVREACLLPLALACIRCTGPRMLLRAQRAGRPPSSASGCAGRPQTAPNFERTLLPRPGPDVCTQAVTLASLAVNDFCGQPGALIPPMGPLAAAVNTLSQARVGPLRLQCMQWQCLPAAVPGHRPQFQPQCACRLGPTRVI